MGSIILDDKTSIGYSEYDGIITISIQKKMKTDDDGIVSNFTTFLTLNRESLKDVSDSLLAKTIYKEFCRYKKKRESSKYSVSRSPTFMEVMNFSKNILGEDEV